MMSVQKKKPPLPVRRPKAGLYLKRNGLLYLMLLLPVAFFIIFRYAPMINIVMALKDYSVFKGVWASPWAHPLFKYFQQAFISRDFFYAVRNTIMLNGLDLLIGFPAPILLALLLNELAFRRYKRFTQAVLYLPHFLSWIIISGIALQVFAPTTGAINMFLGKIGLGKISFLDKPVPWVFTYILMGLWQSMGWNAIIYLAAITGINPELYEAAEVDGANRLKKMWHITLPGILPTISVLLILNLGRILSIELDRPYSLSNYNVLNVADVISSYVYRRGIQDRQYSLAAAVGIFQSFVCIVFLVAANSITKKTGQKGIW
jgi:putative aldouronate transport system permease protein